VCAIKIPLPPHIRPTGRQRNEPIKGLIIGGAMEVHDVYPNFPDVTHFALLEHQIKALEKDNFTHLAHLQGLDISNGPLTTVAWDAFQDLLHLKDLDLSRNRIEYLHPHTLSALPDLEKLNLSNNLMFAIEMDFFSNNKKLTGVNLRHNQIAFVHQRAFEMMPVLRELYFMGNPCLTADYRPPRTAMLRAIFAEKCRETADISERLNEKRMDAESGDYELE
jgi:Leucine rich repeat